MAFNPQALAQALASRPKEAPRSKYLEQALKSMEAGGQNIQGGGGELAARLLAQAITQRAYKKASTEERAAERERQASIMSTLNLGGMVAPTGAAQPQAPMSAPPAPAMPPTAIGPGMDGEPIGPPPSALAAAMQPQQPPAQAPPAMVPAAQGGLPSYRDAAPALLAGALMGSPEASMIGEILQGAAPQLKDVNGMILDMSDPGNTGRYVPQFDKGQEPLFDQRGNVVGVRNMDGSVQSAAEMAGAVEGAKARAQAPYQFEQFEGPGGARVTASRGQLAGMGPVIGQDPATAAAAKIAAEAAATKAVEAPQKEVIWQTQLSALDEMEGLLPNVISGFGADAKLQFDRIKAAAGDEEARKRVSATETFVNQGRILVSQIIRSFGANPTEGERKFAETMSGADAQLDPQTLAEGIRLQRERIARERSASQPAALRQQGTTPPPAQRQPGQIYQTPRGPMKWTGTGWLPQ